MRQRAVEPHHLPPDADGDRGEELRLTYEFMDYSLHLYGEVRQHLRGR